LTEAGAETSAFFIVRLAARSIDVAFLAPFLDPRDEPEHDVDEG
jgi:hypothetical protein